MKQLTSTTAGRIFVGKHFQRVAVVLFEGTPPATIEDVPFDVKDLGAVLADAKYAFYTDVFTLTGNEASNAIDVNYATKSLTREEHISNFQFLPQDVITYNDGYNRPFMKMYGDIDDERSIGDFLSRNSISSGYYGSTGVSFPWYMSERFWTYFEAPKEIEINRLTMSRDRYQGSSRINLQYWDDVEGAWKDITGRDIPDDSYNYNWAGNYTTSWGDTFTYAGNYAYQLTFGNPVTTKKLRIRSGLDAPVEGTSNARLMRNFCISTNTDLSDLDVNITPTWGLAFPWESKLEISDDALVSNLCSLITVGAVGSGSDVELTNTTFDPKYTLPENNMVSNLGFKIKHLVEPV